MLLRYLKRARARSPIWPPSWGPHGPPDTPQLRREAILTSVLSIGSRLSVSIRFRGDDYVALLEEWKPPPSVEQVLAALTAAVGQSVQQVANVDVGSHLPLPADPYSAHDLAPTQRAHIIGTLDAVEEGYVVVAGLRVVLGPGVSVPEDVPIGASVIVVVGERMGQTIATSVRRNWHAPDV